MLEKVQRKGNPLTLLLGIKIGAATMENSTEVSRKTKNRYLNTFLYMNEDPVLNGYP